MPIAAALCSALGTSPRTLLSHGSPHAMGYFSSALGLRIAKHPEAVEDVLRKAS
jgi:hypothetical protein